MHFTPCHVASDMPVSPYNMPTFGTRSGNTDVLVPKGPEQDTEPAKDMASYQIVQTVGNLG